MKHKESKMRRISVAVLLAVCLLSLTGCFGVDGKFTKVRDTVMDQIDSPYETGVEFGVGGFVLGLASKIISWSDEPDAQKAIDLLKQIETVQIGVYSLEQPVPSRGESYWFAQEMSEYLKSQGYETLVRRFGPDGYDMIFLRFHPTKEGKVNELMVMTHETEAFSIVQLRGDVNELVDIASREKEIPGMEEAIEEGFEQ